MTSTSTASSRLIPVSQYSAPATGATIAVNNNGNVMLFINPAGTLLALTITLPSGPTDGDKLTLGSSQAVTGLTMNGGTIIGALTTMSIATFASYTYNSDSTSWFRVG